MYSLSDFGARSLQNFEGLRLRAYRDSNGMLTIGYGHRLYGSPYLAAITQEQADRLFQQDTYLILVELWSETSKLSQNEVDALVSFIFNIGINGWRGSTARRDLVNNLMSAVPGEMMRWVHGSDGGILPGLLSRRQKEVAVFKGAKAA